MAPSVGLVLIGCVLVFRGAAAASIVGPSAGAKIPLAPPVFKHVVLKDGADTAIGKYDGPAVAQCYKDSGYGYWMCGITHPCPAAKCPSGVFEQDGETITLAGSSSFKTGPQLFTPNTNAIRSFSMSEENSFAWIGGAYDQDTPIEADYAKCITRVGSRAAPFSISASGTGSSLDVMCATGSTMKVSVSAGCCGFGAGLVAANAPMEVTISGENAYYRYLVSKTLPPPEKGIKVALNGQNAELVIDSYSYAGELVLTGSVHGEGARIVVYLCKGYPIRVKWEGEGKPEIESIKFDDCKEPETRRRALLAADASGKRTGRDTCPNGSRR